MKLAIDGGKKVISPADATFSWPRITTDTERAVINQLHQSISIYDKSGVFEEFEDKFAKFHGRLHSLLSNSGTSSILAMYESIGLQKGDELICPVYTFHATVSPAMYLGATPIFCDVDNEGNISLEDVKSKITPKTKAVVVTHMWGRPVRNIEEIVSFCKANSLYLLEDCSHAHGATINGKLVGTFGDISAWSLQGQKIITGGEGGIILTDSKKLFNRALLHGHYNKRPAQEIPEGSSERDFYLTGMGLKLRAHPLAIAIANQQFDLLREIISIKQSFAEKFILALRKYDFLLMPKLSADIQNSWYALPILFNESKANVSREWFTKALVAEGLMEVDIPGSTKLLNSLPLFKRPNKIIPRHYNAPLKPQENFSSAEMIYDSLFKIPVWGYKDDAKIVDAYIEGFSKVGDFVLKNR